MKAIRIHGPQDARYEEIPSPEPRPDEVLVRVRAAAICATDVVLFDGTMFYITSGLIRVPFTPGHEWSGEVVAAGDQAREFQPGDRVVGEVSILGCLGGPNLWEEAIDLHAGGRIRTAPIITRRLPLSNFARGIEISRRRIDNAVKVLLEVT